MRTSRFNSLIGLKAEGKGSEKIEKELEKETEKIQNDFKVWSKQLENFLFYVDRISVDEAKKRELFYRGLDPIEAGEILIK